jgi:hypothetical protein
MKQSEAVTHLEHLFLASQKTKSNLEEVRSVRGVPQDSPLLAELKAVTSPLTHNPDLPFMDMLLRVLDIHKETGELEPLAFYNIAVLVATKDEVVGYTMQLRGFPALPKPNMRWIIDGWDNESE